jgi:hypothetical protein
MRRFLTLGSIALVVAAGAAGCGGSSSPDSPPAGNVTKIGQLLDRFQEAAANRDGKGMCSLFTTALRARVEQQSGQKCEQAIPAKLGDPYSAVSVRVVTIGPAVSRAGVQAVEKGGQQATIFLVEQAGEWRIDVIRRPGAGTPLP